MLSSKSLANNKSESHQNIIKKAQSLVLQKDRKQAQELLVAALGKEKRIEAQQEIIESLDGISRLFISDKAQQLYETAIGSMSADSMSGMSAINEGLKLESENLELILLSVMYQIKNNQCESVKSELDKIQFMQNYFEDIQIAFARYELCSSQFSLVQARLEGKDLTKSPHSLIWISIQMELFFKRGQFDQAINRLEKLELTQKRLTLPEITYWQFRTLRELKTRPEAAAQRYIALCKNIGPRQRREFLLEPQICSRTSEVENFLKKADSPEM